MMRIFARASGLTRLIDRYRTDLQPKGVAYARQTVGIGSVRYRRCVTVNVSEEGLWLWVRAPLSRHPAVLIPWEEVKRVQGTRLYGQGATELSVGSPEVGRVTVYASLFEAMRKYVRGAP